MASFNIPFYQTLCFPILSHFIEYFIKDLFFILNSTIQIRLIINDCVDR